MVVVSVHAVEAVRIPHNGKSDVGARMDLSVEALSPAGSREGAETGTCANPGRSQPWGSL